MHLKSAFNVINQVYFIIFLQIVLTTYGFVYAVQYYIAKQEPVILNEIIFTIFHMLLNYVTVFLVYYGTFKRKCLLYIPWLSVYFVIFSMASFLWIKSLYLLANRQLENIFINVFDLSVVWFAWYTILKAYKHLSNGRL